MRLLLLSDGMHPRDGGPPRVVAGSAAALAERGHEVGIIATTTPGDEEEVERAWPRLRAAGVTIATVRSSGPGALVSNSFLPDTLHRRIASADYVHIHQIWSPFHIAAGRMCRQLGTPYAVSGHGLLDSWSLARSRWKKEAALLGGGVRRYLGGADAVVFGTQAEARDARRVPSSARRVAIPNGTWLDRDCDIPPGQQERLKEVAPDFDNWDRSVLFFSRIHPKKGLDMLVEAFIDIADDFPGAGLLAAGIAEDANYEARIRAMAKKSHAANRIVITGQLTGPSSQFLYDSCDIFALPTHQEGFSIAVLEAMAHRMPMLVTEPCRMPQIETLGAGRVVEPSVPALRTALADLLSRDSSALAQAGLQARGLIERKYTWPRVAERLEALYEGRLVESVT